MKDKLLSQVMTQKKLYEMHLPLTDIEQLGVTNYMTTMEVFSSCHIEGNSYIKEETESLIYENKPSCDKSFKDGLEIYNMSRALKYCTEYDNDITIDFILNIHKSLSCGLLDLDDCGKFKSKPNRIGDIQTSTPAHTPIHMDKLVRWYNTKQKIKDNIIQIASEFKYRFLAIHPFADGNGRVSRLIFNWMLEKYGYLRCYIKPYKRQDYYNCLKMCNKNNSYKELYYFMCNAVIDTYKDVILRLEN